MRANLLSGSVGTVAGKAHSAKTFAHLLGVMNEAIAEFDDAIASVVAEHPDTGISASFPGVGSILSAVLLAEIGEDRDRYPTPQTLLAEAGPAPVTRSSGGQHAAPRGRDVVGVQLDQGLAVGCSGLPAGPRRAGAA